MVKSSKISKMRFSKNFYKNVAYNGKQYAKMFHDENLSGRKIAANIIRRALERNSYNRKTARKRRYKSVQSIKPSGGSTRHRRMWG